MSVNFSKPLTLSENEINQFEENIGLSLPETFRNYLLELNGSQPENNVFKIDEKNSSGVNGLIPVSQMADERQYLHHVDEKVFPIAWAEGGNYVVVNFEKGSSIYFWDHEEPEKQICLGLDITEFLSKLEPFDLDSVELKDGQVESVWIDPDFLKNL